VIWRNAFHRAKCAKRAGIEKVDENNEKRQKREGKIDG
jgi:hypothetical protein